MYRNTKARFDIVLYGFAQMENIATCRSTAID